MQHKPVGRQLEPNVNGSAAERNETVKVVLLATDWLIGALSRTKTNHRDWVTSEAHSGSDVANGNS